MEKMTKNTSKIFHGTPLVFNRPPPPQPISNINPLVYPSFYSGGARIICLDSLTRLLKTKKAPVTTMGNGGRVRGKSC